MCYGVSMTERDVWDCIAVGAGPAGMMAACVAAERGARVIIVEKNDRPGEKLLITGGGRCNITNNTPNPKEMAARYGEASKFLVAPFTHFGVTETLAFFHALHVDTHEEAEGRVFPATNSAATVHHALLARLSELGVTLRTRSPVASLYATDGAASGVQLADGTSLYGKAIIISTGGISRPETGSTGDGFAWLAGLGHTVRTVGAALVPLSSKDVWVRRLTGTTLTDTRLTAYVDGVKAATQSGKMLFTHVGLSGPAVLNFSSTIGELIQSGIVTLGIDPLPHLAPDVLHKKLLSELQAHSNQHIRTVLAAFVPAALAAPILEQAQVDGATPAHSLTRDSRIRVLQTMKNLTARIDGLLGTDKAIVTSGGVSLTEIDTRTMESRIVRNLYLIGDVLDINRPSGGYSLQLCWTTGFCAGEEVARRLHTDSSQAH